MSVRGSAPGKSGILPILPCAEVPAKIKEQKCGMRACPGVWCCFSLLRAPGKAAVQAFVGMRAWQGILPTEAQPRFRFFPHTFVQSSGAGHRFHAKAAGPQVAAARRGRPGVALLRPQSRTSVFLARHVAGMRRDLGENCVSSVTIARL